MSTSLRRSTGWVPTKTWKAQAAVCRRAAEAKAVCSSNAGMYLRHSVLIILIAYTRGFVISWCFGSEFVCVRDRFSFSAAHSPASSRSYVFERK